MSASTDPGNVFGGILKGAIVGILIPIFQKVILGVVATAPSSEMSGPTVSLIIFTVHLMALLPIIETVIGFGVAYASGRYLGLVGYVLGVLGASVLFNAPELFVALFISGFIVFTLGALLHSGGSGGRRPGGF